MKLRAVRCWHHLVLFCTKYEFTKSVQIHKSWRPTFVIIPNGAVMKAEKLVWRNTRVNMHILRNPYRHLKGNYIILYSFGTLEGVSITVNYRANTQKSWSPQCSHFSRDRLQICEWANTTNQLCVISTLDRSKHRLQSSWKESALSGESPCILICRCRRPAEQNAC